MAGRVRALAWQTDDVHVAFNNNAATTHRKAAAQLTTMFKTWARRTVILVLGLRAPGWRPSPHDISASSQPSFDRTGTDYAMTTSFIKILRGGWKTLSDALTLIRP
jgi:hypothetical protein